MTGGIVAISVELMETPSAVNPAGYSKLNNSTSNTSMPFGAPSRPP